MPQTFADELSSIPTSPSLGESLERAQRFAREQSHRAVTLEHLLLALTEDSEAALILQSANVDLARLSTDVSGYLGRLLDDMRSDGVSEPRPDADLLRVLQAAASAAKQSRRRQIDGAIVLAAIVGDGKSPAAGLLKALGMTFEEAIRALQRANTKARLKPAAKQGGAAPTAPRVAAVQPAAAEPAQPPAETTPTETTVPAAAGVSQSAEDILAAARARIQQRAASGGKPEPAPSSRRQAAEVSGKPVPAATSEDGEPPAEAVEPGETMALTEAIEAAMSVKAARTIEAEAEPPPPEPAARVAQPQTPSSPPAPPFAQQARPAWTPPPDPRPTAAAQLPQPPPARPPLPFPARPIAPGEGPRRPPLPAAPQNASQPQPGFPNRPPRAPWPDPGERPIPVPGAVRPPLPNGAYAEAPPAPPLAPPAGHAGRAQQSSWTPAPQRGSPHPDKGLLVESVPRRVRMGVPASAEVRIARDRIDALIATLSSRGSMPLAEQPLMRALSVRLRAPGADFWIEPAAPETQWVESGSSLIHDDYAVWRWTVVGRRHGRGRLALMVSARTIGRDGVAAESAPPDRVIEVKIGGNYRQSAARWAGLIVAVLAGFLLGAYSEPIWTLVGLALNRAL